MWQQIINTIQQELSLETFGILLSLIVLETILSADNAVALAAIVLPLPKEEHQRKALNLGLVSAFMLRIMLILTATWVIQFWEFEFLGSLYLLWLAGKYFWGRWSNQEENSQESIDLVPSYQAPQFWQVIPLIAVTDLAFSLDSVTTAVAFSNRTWLVLAGGMIGVITLRFLAGLFIKLIETFVYLQDAAYLTILGVGLKLMGKALCPNYVPPEWMILILIAMLFIWGFSKRNFPETSSY